MRRCVPLFMVCVAFAACAAEDSPENDTAWVGTITTEGNVTTVVNESGSVWGGMARLVGGLSIGVDVGDDAYMFGRPGGVHAFGGRIYVIDQQVPVVRVYDFDGAHLFDFGAQGQGPGEFQSPYSIAGTDDGRIFIADSRNGRINVYSADGEYVADYPTGRLQCCIRPLVATPDGLAFFHIYDRELSLEHGVDQDYHPMRGFDENGPTEAYIGPPQVEIPAASFRLGDRVYSTRFSPDLKWRVAPSGALIFGTSERYRFEVRHPTGDSLIVEQAWDPVPIQVDEREWARRQTVASLRRNNPGWRWDGAEMPDSKPAFEDFIAAYSGEVWVVRPGPGIKDPDCDDKHSPDDWPYFSENYRCWRNQPIIDAFDAEGTYVGGIEVPEGIVLNSIAPPYIRGDTVVAALYEPDGVIRVKRYRLVLPGER